MCSRSCCRRRFLRDITPSFVSGSVRISLLAGGASIQAFARFREVSIEFQPGLGSHGEVFPVVTGVMEEACLADDVDGIGQDLGRGVGIWR